MIGGPQMLGAPGCSPVSTPLIPPLGIGRIYSKEENSGFLQVVAESIFSRGQTTVEFFFYNSKLRKKYFQISKFLGPVQGPQAPPSNNHENEDIVYTYDKPRSSHNKLTHLPHKDSVM